MQTSAQCLHCTYFSYSFQKGDVTVVFLSKLFCSKFISLLRLLLNINTLKLKKINIMAWQIVTVHVWFRVPLEEVGLPGCVS